MATPPRKTGLIAAEKTTSLFSSHVQQRDLSRERIAQDMEAFDKAGGQIEVLGNTPFRPKLTPEKPAASATASGDGTEKPRSHKRK